MNVVELHYRTFASKYIIIGRITEIPNGGGCSFFTETKASPSKTYYDIVTDYGVSDPKIYIKEAEGGIRTNVHPILCLVKYDGNWCIALPPTDRINNFDVCDPNYSCGTNAGLAYPFISWFNQGLEVTWDDLEDEVNPTYTNLRENEQQGNKAVRYPILPYLGSIQISPIGSIPKDYLVLGVLVPDSWNYMKMTIEALPYDTNVSGVFETYTILAKKDSINGVTTERKIDVIRDTVGEKANSTQSINFCTYGNYIFILLKSQRCYSISNFASVNNNCSMRLMSQRQACSIANNTLAEGVDKYTVNTGVKWFFPSTINPSGAVTLRYNNPRLIKQYGTTTERNNLINGMNSDNVTLSGNTSANTFISYVRGFRYYDTTLKKPLYLTSTQTNGAGGWYWVDANGNNPDILTKGTTEQRPATTDITEGFEFYDSTLKKKILYNGTDWVNVDGTPLTNS